MRLAPWALLWLTLIGCCGALAHVTTTGLLRIEFTGGRMLYALSLALPELPAASAAILTAAANADRGAAEAVAEAARRSVTVDLDGGRCRAGRVRIGGAGTNETRATIEIDFTCDASHGRLDITEDWRAFLGEHYQTLGNLRTPSGERQVIFGEESRSVTVDIDRTVATGWFDFVKLGIEHILTGYDHLLFLVALLATARGAWSVVRIVTAFTLAHSVTLSVAALGIVTIPDRIIEPLIAATIVWVALENFFVGRARQEAVDLEFRFRPCARLRVCLRTRRTRPEGGDTGARAGGFQCGGRDRAADFRRCLPAGADVAVARPRRAADPAHRLAGGGGDRHLLAGRTHLCWLSAVVAAALEYVG